MNPYGAITDVIDPAHQQAMTKQAALLARMAVSAEGTDTLLLPSAENTLSGWAAEHVYSGAQVAMGSSLDEQVLASHLADIVAEVLGIEPTLMNLAVASVTYEALRDEIEVATRLHQNLLKARRVGGWQLQHLLKEVRPRDLATMVIDKAKSLPPIPKQALDELKRVVWQFEESRP